MPSKQRETVSSSQDNSPTGEASQIQRKYRRKQLKHLPVSTTARHMLTLSFSTVVKYIHVPSVSERSSISSGHAKSSSKTNAADEMSAFPGVCNCACIIARVKLEINLTHLVTRGILLSMYVACPLAAYAARYAFAFDALIKRDSRKTE